MSGSTNRRDLTTTVLLGIVGGAMTVIAASRVWASGTGGQAPMALKVTASGSDLSGGISILGLVGIAGSLALFATARLGRQLVGLLLAASGIGLIVTVAAAHETAHVAAVLANNASIKGVGSTVTGVDVPWGWDSLAMIGGIFVVLVGIRATMRGRTWPGMSNRYEAPAAKEARTAAAVRDQAGTPKGLWDALDRGEDPTSQVPAGTRTPDN